MSKIKLGFAMCGSFCTFQPVLRMMEKCRDLGYDLVPIMSQNASSIDTRFGKAEDFIWQVEDICGKKIINTINDAEPIGPTHMTDIMLVSPCTGNTLAKLANSIVDTSVTMAVKSHLRNNKPVVIAVSTNDALSGSAKNIGALLNLKNYYFVPMRQDNPEGKPTSIVADFSLIPDTLEEALQNTQIQPIMLERKQK
ncbi:dipicolinate synthase subunit B [Fumia xinanensis]|uniref:dipicolinate synthase subunit B n=1 Tax=Fumia xinanensis TaxID=2763659 RepID=UPI002016672F